MRLKNNGTVTISGSFRGNKASIAPGETLVVGSELGNCLLRNARLVNNNGRNPLDIIYRFDPTEPVVVHESAVGPEPEEETPPVEVIPIPKRHQKAKPLAKRKGGRPRKNTVQVAEI